MTQSLRDDLYNEIVQLPVIDVHSHLDAESMAAKDLGAVMFYHMLLYPLRSSGVDQKTLWPEGEHFHNSGRPYDEFIANWPRLGNTGFGWILKTILRELYDFDEPLTRQSLDALMTTFGQRVSQPGWARQVIDKGNIQGILSSSFWIRREGTGRHRWAEAKSDGLMHYTMEMSPEIGTYEYLPWKERFERNEKHGGKAITSVEVLDEVNENFYGRFDWSNKHALVWWVSSLADFRTVPDSTVNAIITHCRAGEPLDAVSESLLEAAYIRSVCRAIRPRTGVLQLVYGTQFITAGSPHPIERAAPHFTDSLGYLFGEFPDIHFNILSGYEPDEPILCSLCLGYHNVSLGGFWWQTFYPSVMHAAWHRRLDMVPTGKLAGFFSDGYCVDWMFGRLRMTQRVLANVFAEKIDRGFLTAGQAVSMARDILCTTPQELFLNDNGKRCCSM